MKDKILKLIFRVVVAVSVVGCFVSSIFSSIGIYNQSRIIRSERGIVNISIIGENYARYKDVEYYEIDTRTGIVTIHNRNGSVSVLHIDNIIIYETEDDLEG